MSMKSGQPRRWLAVGAVATVVAVTLGCFSDGDQNAPGQSPKLPSTHSAKASEGVAEPGAGRTAPLARDALFRACEFLWKKQDEDGGWHSGTYGLLRSGQALTPFVLHALLSVSDEVCPRPAQQVANALRFIRRHTNENGIVGVADAEVLEYPNYSTAYALRCLLQVGTKDDEALAARMRSYLAAEQYRMGFRRSSPTGRNRPHGPRPYAPRA
jgi:hypothetical protein